MYSATDTHLVTATPQPWVDPAVDDRPPPPVRFSLQGLFLFNTLVGILLSVPFLAIGLGYAALLLLCLMVLQLPLFYLFGAFQIDRVQESASIARPWQSFLERGDDA